MLRGDIADGHAELSAGEHVPIEKCQLVHRIAEFADFHMCLLGRARQDTCLV